MTYTPETVELKAKVKELEAKIKELEAKIKELEAKIKELESEISEHVLLRSENWALRELPNKPISEKIKTTGVTRHSEIYAEMRVTFLLSQIPSGFEQSLTNGTLVHEQLGVRHKAVKGKYTVKKDYDNELAHYTVRMERV